MIVEANFEARKKLVPMFEKIDSTILLSYLQGHMGSAWVDNVENPTVAQITVGIFVFYAGNPFTKEANELLHNLPDFTLAIVESEEWKERLEKVHSGAFERFQRYRFERNPGDLERPYMQNLIASLPDDYEMKKVDKAIVNASDLSELSEDFISQFNSSEDFLDRGVGYAILHGEKIVSAATSFSIYNEGIEIEVATHPDYRRKGLASIVSAALILDCLDRGKYPSWDGANAESVKLAEKLGYVFKESYDTYFINK